MIELHSRVRKICVTLCDRIDDPSFEGKISTREKNLKIAKINELQKRSIFAATTTKPEIQFFQKIGLNVLDH